MNLQELKDKVQRIEKIGYGHWLVTIKYRNKYYSSTTNNSMAVDATSYDECERRSGHFYPTCKKGYEALYEECLRENNLGNYKY